MACAHPSKGILAASYSVCENLKDEVRNCKKNFLELEVPIQVPKARLLVLSFAATTNTA